MFRFKVIYLDGAEDEADCGPLAQIEFERTYKMLFTDAFDTDADPPRARLEYQYFLTWASLKNAGKDVGGDFEKWLKRVKDGGLILSDDQVKRAKGNPTRRARPRAGSSD